MFTFYSCYRVEIICRVISFICIEQNAIGEFYLKITKHQVLIYKSLSKRYVNDIVPYILGIF